MSRLPLEMQSDGDEVRLRVALVGQLRHVQLHVVHQRQHQLRVQSRQTDLHKFVVAFCTHYQRGV